MHNTSIDAIAGCLAYQGPAKTIEEMDDDIQQGIARSGDNMIPIDTNVMVRFLTRDDEVQYQKAYIGDSQNRASHATG